MTFNTRVSILVSIMSTFTIRAAVIEDTEAKKIQRQIVIQNRMMRLLCENHLYLRIFPDDDCKFLFRFTYQQMQQLVLLFGLKEKMFFQENSRGKFSLSAIESVAILLHRLSYSSRLGDLAIFFGRSESTLSPVFKELVCRLHLKFRAAMIFDYNQFKPENLERFSNAIYRKCQRVQHCIGFIDGTFVKVARPTDNQEQCYTGHYRAHGLKYQAVVTPDGITSSFYGPVVGSHHDMFLYRESRIETYMRNTFDFRHEHGPCYHLYGDLAYVSSEYMMHPFGNAPEDSPYHVFNMEMSRLCVSVEHEFSYVGNLFSFVKFVQNQRLFLSPVASHYIVATLLKNIYVCFNRGNQTSMKFNVLPPIPQNYVYGLLH
ncbi:hypothetical protein PHYBLDRAFT_186089 [Phycomyces blakesleeanus NRRL 1555(-)]|uniref:DDE Tnp4 domain-containing protein n=1 Tax=Phycomyces blakesleeanus (strain ATCC 8743b / DSM 1359 / FGSC 10004 / NBRC 33097 / NRRL 1555) TaxID=763407 RepID=A0A167NIL8_PHYB8|nr:hypothetical protein PHYBLDRAFT_186089 [Phycomyces blakesleeanus NRRL 1555(-)]OAD76008.1 hypothetical protein PHYBLDRAFT_186089 [Phycomyces blakesleeanus NRRL 1555(-)]|eukprot:XP_018294048.1 hypothetical protein PHYBLDRAFT_186089 [Phycomyces blakesleeanus NRRL 1555(-)]